DLPRRRARGRRRSGRLVRGLPQGVRRDRHRPGARHQADGDAALALASGVPETSVTRWALLTLGAFIALGVIGVATARFFGKSGSKLSIQISIAAHWFAAYILWSFAAGLAA